MLSDEMKDNIRRHYGDSDSDLADLGAIMDALKDLDKLDELKRELEAARLENDKALKDLDANWRARYRERFFDGDTAIPELNPISEDETDEQEEITIDEYLDSIMKDSKN